MLETGDYVAVVIAGHLRGVAQIMVCGETQHVAVFVGSDGRPIKDAHWIVFDQSEVIKPPPLNK